MLQLDLCEFTHISSKITLMLLARTLHEMLSAFDTIESLHCAETQSLQSGHSEGRLYRRRLAPAQRPHAARPEKPGQHDK